MLCSSLHTFFFPLYLLFACLVFTFPSMYACFFKFKSRFSQLTNLARGFANSYDHYKIHMIYEIRGYIDEYSAIPETWAGEFSRLLSAIRSQIHRLGCRRQGPLLCFRCLVIHLEFLFSRARGRSMRISCTIAGGGRLMSGAHIFIEGVRLVHLVGLDLLCVKPAL